MTFPVQINVLKDTPAEEAHDHIKLDFAVLESDTRGSGHLDIRPNGSPVG